MITTFDYSDIPTCEAFSESDKFVRGLMGAFGSGKSSTCVWEIIQRSLAQKPNPDGIRRTRWAVVRNTYPQLNDTTMKTFHDWFPPSKFGKYRDQKHEYLITRFPKVEIEILYRALDRPDQVDNLLSLELTGAWLNEAREIPETIFEAIQGRVGRFPSERDEGCTWDGVIMDTNPPDTDSWWFRLFEESLDSHGTCSEILDDDTLCGKPAVRVFNKGSFEELCYCAEHDKYALFKQPSGLSKQAENLTHLKKGYYKNLAAGKKAEFIKVYVHGDYGYVIDGKPVYPEYNDAQHCQAFEVTPEIPVRRGWDFGLTPGVTFSQMHPTGQWRIFDEFQGINIGADKFSDDIQQYCQQQYQGMTFEDDFGDPAGDAKSQADEKTCFEILRSKGISIIAGDQDPGMRVECVKRPLNRMIDGHPGFLLHPRCKMLRKGFKGGYYYRKMQNKSGTISEKPEKNDLSHLHDALQYDATRLFSYELRSSKPETQNRYDNKHRRRRGSWMTA